MSVDQRQAERYERVAMSMVASTRTTCLWRSEANIPTGRVSAWSVGMQLWKARWGFTASGFELPAMHA